MEELADTKLTAMIECHIDIKNWSWWSGSEGSLVRLFEIILNCSNSSKPFRKRFFSSNLIVKKTMSRFGEHELSLSFVSDCVRKFNAGY